MRPHRRQPTRLPCPWDSPGKNTGVGCHFLLQCRKVKSESEVTQSCPTLCDPMDCSPPGSSVHGIFQARVLEWGAIAFSKVVSDSATPWSVVCQDYTTTKSNKVLMHAATWMDRKGIMLVEISQSQKTTDFMILSTTPCHLPRALVIYLCVCKSLSRFQLFVTPSTVARQAPLSMGFSGQESWSGLPFPSLGVIYLYKDSILLLQLLTFNPP